MTIRVCEANGGVLPRQVLIDTDGCPPPCSHPHHLCRKKGTSLSRCLLLAEMVDILPRADCLRPAGRRPVLIRTYAQECHEGAMTITY